MAKSYIAIIIILTFILTSCAPGKFVQLGSGEEGKAHSIFGIVSTPKMVTEQIQAECPGEDCMPGEPGSQVMETISIAVNTMDPSLCEKDLTGNARVRCYTEIAEINNDVSICENIEEQHGKEYCYLQLGRHNPEICKKITGENDRYSCYVLAAKEKSDVMFCENIALESSLLEPCFRSAIKDPELSGKCNELKQGYSEKCLSLFN